MSLYLGAHRNILQSSWNRKFCSAFFFSFLSSSLSFKGKQLCGVLDCGDTLLFNCLFLLVLFYFLSPVGMNAENNDDRVLLCCLQYQRLYPECAVTLCTWVPHPPMIYCCCSRVSPLQIMHMHVTEQVQPDSSSWDETARQSDCARIDVLSMGFWV